MASGSSTRSARPAQPMLPVTLSAQASRRRLGALALERALARLRQALGDLGLDGDPLIQDLADPVAELHFVHHFVSSVMPRALSASANACVAREQCVFTLPSEQPIALAVSATSSSSQ